MYLSLKLILFCFVILKNFIGHFTLPVNATYKENSEVVQNSSVSWKESLPVQEVKNNNTSNCINLWDVDAELIKHGKKDIEQTLKERNNDRQKRFDLKETIKKVSNDLTKKDDKEPNERDEKEAKKTQKRSAGLVNLVCVKNGNGVQCQSNNTEIVFNDPDITDDMIRESIQALLSNGVFTSKEEGKKTKIRGCGCEETTQSTPVWCSTPPATVCECSTELTVDECVIHEETTECQPTTMAPCQKNLINARSDNRQLEAGESADTSFRNAHPIKRTDSFKNVKTESQQPEMYLVCSTEDGGDPAVYSCKWKSRKED